MRLARFILILAAAATAFGLLAKAEFAHGQASETERLARLKAAYVFNFIKYTTWPNSAFADDAAPLVVTVVGRCDLFATLDEVLRRASPINGRPLVLRQLNHPTADAMGRIDPDELSRFYQRVRESHLLYMCSLDTVQLRAMLREVEGRNILTAGDLPRLAHNGGMLGLTVRENTLRIQANVRQIRKSQLSVSAKLLNIAEIIEE